MALEQRIKRTWLDDTRVAVWGLGKSGVAAAQLLARRGYDVVASDTRDEASLQSSLEGLDPAVEVVFGDNVIGDAQWVVTSPGLPPSLDIFKEAKRRAIPVVSEVELAYAFSDARWLGITGTDGKTTTTTLLGNMVAASDQPGAVAGNIGTALCSVVEDLASRSLLVVEVSANQLWTCHGVRTEAAAITNIAEDHVDYFVSEEQYEEAKCRLIAMQEGQGDAVLPSGNAPWKRRLLAEHPRSKVIEFGVGRPEGPTSHRAVYFEGGVGHWRHGEDEGIWCPDFEDSALIGPHNQANAACAAALAWSAGLDWESIEAGLMDTPALAHRMEWIAEVDQVAFIDDSKATNAHASWAGLQGVKGPLVAIVGGLDKGLKLDEWAKHVAHRAEAVVITGAIEARMASLFAKHPVSVHRAPSMDRAVQMAKNVARPGSTVVLSPACSSYDRYANYRQRGRDFQDAVRRLR